MLHARGPPPLSDFCFRCLTAHHPRLLHLWPGRSTPSDASSPVREKIRRPGCVPTADIVNEAQKPTGGTRGYPVRWVLIGGPGRIDWRIWSWWERGRDDKRQKRAEQNRKACGFWQLMYYEFMVGCFLIWSFGSYILVAALQKISQIKSCPERVFSL